MEPGFELRQSGVSHPALNNSKLGLPVLGLESLRRSFPRDPIALIRRRGCLEMGAWSPCPVGPQAMGAELEPLEERMVFYSILTIDPFSAYKMLFSAHQGAES